MDLSGFNWSLLTIVGPLLLVAVIAWAMLHNRASRRRRDDSERATHRVYDEEDRAHRGEGGGTP